ncbi:uncharacterized protein LOC123878978 isoform X1 [Maniola jurtina]|uniref:uncharacterized protein LOC123878978 isoform X1 n=1 Tax=Maniola jurtina TaxID=191418 RepID=UPI001E687A06|nr:uncharacterized protein LOC123878978 isoform X1 [Maniola jurtina]
MKDDDDEEADNTFGVQRYPCMPSLVALQQMRNRLHLAFLGKKLMKWTALATGRELRHIAAELYKVYDGFSVDVRNAFILLARSRYFYPQLNHIVTEDIAEQAAVVVRQATKQVSSVKITQFEIVETEHPAYAHLGLEKGGQTIQEAKKAWLELLKRLILMMQLRTSFLMVEEANRNATKKWNVLSKLVIPRIKVSCQYITSELEEIEREDNFRLKRFKELKIKKNKEKEGVIKKDSKMEVPAKVCCNAIEPLTENRKIRDNIIDSCQKTVKSSCSSQCLKYNQSKIPCASPPVYEVDKICSCEVIKPTIIEEPVCDCEPLEKPEPFCSCTPMEKPVTLEPVCSCKALSIPDNVESVCSCEQLKKPVEKESKVSVADRKIQTDNLKYSYSHPLSQEENESPLSTKVAVRFHDDRDKSTISSQPPKMQNKASFDDKPTQTVYSTDPICGCSAHYIKDDNRNDHIFSSNKKRVKGIRSDLSPQAKAIGSEESGICCNKSPGNERSTRTSKSDQIRYTKPITENKSDKSISCTPVKSQNKVSFQDKEIQTKSQSNFPSQSKSSACLLPTKEKIGSSEEGGKYMRTFKETVKITKKPDKNGNICEKHRTKTVKTEKRIIGNPITSKKSLKQVSKTPSTAIPYSSDVAAKPCEKDSSILTKSKAISLASIDLSQPVSESESLVQDVNLNTGGKSSTCSNKSTGSSTSQFESCESTKSTSSSCTSDIKCNSRFKPGSDSLKVKIVAKSDDETKQNDETKIELTPSTLNIIKLILLGLSKSEISNKSSEMKQEGITRSAKFNYDSMKTKDLPQKNCLCSSKADTAQPSSGITTCNCKDTYNNLISQQPTAKHKCSSMKEILQVPAVSQSCSCDKVKDMLANELKTNQYCNKSQSLPTINTRNCTCGKNVIEKPPLTKPQGYSCQRNKTSSPKAYELSGIALPSCSCSKAQNISKSNTAHYKLEDKSYESKQKRSNESSKHKPDKTCSCKSSSNIKMSDKICPNCNQQPSSTSVCSTSRNESSSSYKKSLRFSDSLQTKTTKSCSCLSQKKLNNSLKSCSSKSSGTITSQSQNFICPKCSVTKVDASTSTRRSDKYDVRPLRLLMDRKTCDSSCKSDTVILRAYRKPDSCHKLIKRCHSCNDNDKYNFRCNH